MKVDEKVPAQVRQVLEKGLLKRLPATFLPFINQHLRNWQVLFPFEQGYVSRILLYLGSLQDKQCAELFRDIYDLEPRMGVSHWSGFSTQEETIENSSLLARSPYYLQWRREVQKVFDQINKEAPTLAEQDEANKKRRLILLVLPARVPLDPATVWAMWQGKGRAFALEWARSGKQQSLMEALLCGVGKKDHGPDSGLFGVLRQSGSGSVGDMWVIETGTEVGDLLHSSQARPRESRAATLSFPQLKPLRDTFLETLNGIQRDLGDADSAYARLRRMDITGLCPPEIGTQPPVREFVRELFLNGNGGLVFPNSFVEWGSVEALRRARPSVLVAHFGTRNKPKPFTSVAVFENQEKASPQLDEEDLPGSAVDVEMLAYYVWLAVGRYPEYYGRTACLCFGEDLPVVYVVAPPDFPLMREKEPLQLENVSQILGAWLS
jgi:hypothetical protein